MFASAILGGMPGMVVAANGGQFAYGFQLEAGQIKRPDGQVIRFEQRSPGVNDGNMSGYDTWGNESVGGYSSGDYEDSLGAHAAQALAGSGMGYGLGALLGAAAGPVLSIGAGVVMDSDVMTHAPWGEYGYGWNQSQSETDGGPNPSGSYTDNGSNYGGHDGNTSPDGSAINGFE
jgi:hypothetical protein